MCTREKITPDQKCACGVLADLLCDEPLLSAPGTCDIPICHRCAIEVGTDAHRCPKHAPRTAEVAVGMRAMAAERQRRPLLALSVRQPYATALLYGTKDVENRDWRPDPQEHPTPFWILLHAGQKYYEPEDQTIDECADDVREIWERDIRTGRQSALLPTMPPLASQPRGVALGLLRVSHILSPDEAVRIVPPDPPKIAEMDDYGSTSPWISGAPWCWIIDRKIPLPAPVSMRGRQGLFEPPPVIVAQAREVYAAHHAKEKSR
jgi:hypothetical protein